MISLSDLVGDVAAFERDHWGRRPALRSTELPFGDLLDIRAVERLLAASPRP